ncbi:MAG: tetratricopeptide repeat protein [Phycisphaerae bacterium]|nr:tetratricopeptide repeat protein [Phycisphaerae bacterium]
MNDWMDAEKRVEHAHKLYEKGRWPEAAAELRAAIESNPFNPSWYFNLGLALEAMEDHLGACKAFQTAHELDPDDIETLNCLGVNYTRLGKYAEALGCFEVIQKVRPDYEPCYCNRIVTYTELSRHDEAEMMFYLARQVKDECPLCYFNIGNSFYAREQYDRAIDCWRQTLRLSPDHTQAHARIGDAYWAKGDLQHAREHYEAEAKLSDDNSEALLDLGEVLMELGDFSQAEVNIRTVVEKDPQLAAGHFCLGELAEKRGDFAHAEYCYRKTLMLETQYPGVRTRLARLLLRQNRQKQAAQMLIEELRRCGSDPSRLQEVGELLIEARQTHKAREVLSRLVEIKPHDAHARHNLAVSCFLLDSLNEGIRHCRQALRLQPKYPLALYNLALAHLRKGQEQRARHYVARAMRLAPEDKNILQLGRRLGLQGFWSKLRVRLVPKRTKQPKPAEE